MLKVLFYNAENLFISLEKFQDHDLATMSEDTWQSLKAGLTPNKPLNKTLKLARLLKENNPDIILLTEVGGEHSLSAFNQYFLQDHYHVFCPPSNSNRGIDLGILVKKDLPYINEITNFLEYEVEKKKKTFNRNVLKLALKQNSKTVLKFYVVHLKSKLDFEKKDFWGLKARTEEVKGLIQILNRDSKDRAPFVVAGDFNGNASLYNTDNEFLNLYDEKNQFKIKDTLEILNIPPGHRHTHNYFKGAFRQSSQIDYLFLSENLWDKVESEGSGVVRYKNEYGEIIDPPGTLEIKQSYPSDHNPLMVTIRSIK